MVDRKLGVTSADEASAHWEETTNGKRVRHRAYWFAALSVALLVAAAPLTGTADAGTKDERAVVPQTLLDAAAAQPERVFDVIVQGRAGTSSDDVAGDVAQVGATKKPKNTFETISAVAVSLEGETILKLAEKKRVYAITPDSRLHSSVYENAEMWRDTSNIRSLQTLAVKSATPIGIAIVDSGIDATRVADFGTRVVARVNLSSLSPGATGDQQGHGTMVAGIAAGASSAYPGAAPNARLVDVRTADANGQSLTSDVIAGIDWIVAHKVQYGIRVANFSMTGNAVTTFQADPLDKAVEKLWFNGILVVAASGNHGTGTGEVDMSGAPGNDPFVITVGAVDQHQTSSVTDDTIAPWSAYGHTADGFAKPELSAPGRYMIMPVPAAATIPKALPERVVAPGYMWMSGTSFAAPVVAGAAALILGQHPEWTPDQVKGALMLTARPIPGGGFAGGVGQINAGAAAAVTAPPNPNENLNRFIVTDPVTGARTFDDKAWAAAASSNTTWTSAAWTSAAWTSAAWTSAAWTSAAWTSAAWTSAAWTSAAWTSAAWTSSQISTSSWSE